MKCILTGATRKSIKNFWVKWLNDIFSASVNNIDTMKLDIIMHQQIIHTYAHTYTRHTCIQGFFSNYVFRPRSDLISLLSSSCCCLCKMTTANNLIIYNNNN